VIHERVAYGTRAYTISNVSSYLVCHMYMYTAKKN